MYPRNAAASDRPLLVIYAHVMPNFLSSLSTTHHSLLNKLLWTYIHRCPFQLYFCLTPTSPVSNQPTNYIELKYKTATALSARINIIWYTSECNRSDLVKGEDSSGWLKWSNHWCYFAHIKALSSSNNIETLVSIKVTQLALTWEGGPDPWWLVSTFCFASCQTLPDTITSPSPGQARQSWHWCKLKGAPAQKRCLVPRQTKRGTKIQHNTCLNQTANKQNRQGRRI